MKTKRKIDTNVWKTGNSYVVTIPSYIIKFFKLKSGSKITLTIEELEEGGKYSK